jgi:Precorrin-2 methylase
VSAAGKLVGVGVGPGDPELITLKAVRVLEEADVVVHFAKSGTTGNARAIAERYLRPGIREAPADVPGDDRTAKGEAAYCDIIGAFYDAAAREWLPISTTAAWSPSSARATRCSTALTCICMCAWRRDFTPRSLPA